MFSGIYLIIISYVAFTHVLLIFLFQSHPVKVRKAPPTTSSLRKSRRTTVKPFFTSLQKWNVLQSTPVGYYPNSWNTFSYLRKLSLL